MSKECEHCNKVLLRREKEDAFNFAKRRFCGRSCAYAYRTTKVPPKDCEQCGRLLVKPDNVSASQFVKRKFCSRQCHSAYATTKVPLKNCEQCGEAMTKRRKELGAEFARRKFCSQQCSVACNAAKPSTCNYCDRRFMPHGSSSRFCSRKCSGSFRAHRVNVHGVSLSRQELADALGVTVGVIGARIRKGRCPVSGKRNE